MISDPTESRELGIAYHLTPRDVWEPQRELLEYVPQAYAADGFIHLTNGTDKLLWVANQFYATDPRDYIVLELAMAAITAPTRYDDPDEFFPHVYGPLNTDSVRGELKVRRSNTGEFLGFDDA